MIPPVQEVQKAYINIYWKISICLVTKKQSSKDIYLFFIEKLGVRDKQQRGQKNTDSLGQW